MPTAVRKAAKEPTKARQQPNLAWRSNDRFGFNKRQQYLIFQNFLRQIACNLKLFVTFASQLSIMKKQMFAYHHHLHFPPER